VSTATLLLLADGRLPAGGYAHSGGVEAAVAAGTLRDLTTLGNFLDGRLATTALVDSSAAALAWGVAGHRTAGTLGHLDREVAARTPSPALRAASRAQSRGLLRLARRAWPGPVVDAAGAAHADGPCWAVAVGAVAAAAGLDGGGAALLATASAVTGPAWAAVRLLGLDPLGVAALLADRSAGIDRVAAEGAARADETADPADLPAAGGPLLDIGAERHATWEVRLFAS
jgi:urease accessory protein